ncbi:MAG TPA: 3'-5' exonuclease [Opitutaceae bacterium]
MSWLSLLRRTPRAPVVQAYLDATSAKVRGKTPLDALSFVVLDAETTGFSVGRDRLLSLAVMPVRAGRLAVAGTRCWLVQQSAVPLNEAMQVHGILPSDTAAGEPEERVLAELLPTLAGAVLVGHHIGFDIAMLNAALQRHYRVRLRNPVLDTALMARHALEAFAATAYPGQQPPSLDEVCALCGIPVVERHTAEGDTFTTAELFLVLCARLQRLRGRPLLASDLPITRG